MRKYYIFLMGLLFIVSAHAQKVQLFKYKQGSFRIQYFDTNIVRVQFKEPGYHHNEMISDAVVMWPHGGETQNRVMLSDSGLMIRHGHKSVALDFFHYQDSRGYSFKLNEGERIYGAGERALPLNRRGYRLNLYNNPWYGYAEGADNLNYSVPFITSSGGYGLFFDNPSRAYLDIGKTRSDRLEYGASSGEINVYVIFGNYQQVLTSYYRLTGTQPLPPRWAFGNFMSRFGYTSEAQVKEILSRMKQEKMPVDAIIFDLFWFGDSIKGTMGNLDWVNKNKWPDAHKMISDFKDQGINTILVTEPFFVETSRNYRASKPYLAVDSLRRPYYLTDFYFGKGGLIDIFRKDARDWFWRFYKKQIQNGVEGWWGDLGEPEKHPADLYHNLKDIGFNRLFSSEEVHNLYGHTWTKMLYQHYASEYPNKRLFSLNRSGFAGSQRYGIIPWTGDVSRSWSGLKAQLPVLLGMSMSGVPYVHSDAGGFAGGDGDNELYIRWLQFAAFTPVFRPHGTALYIVDPSAYSFPSEAALIDTPYRQMAKSIIQYRYAMLPYNYSLAYQQQQNAKPLIAPLYYYFPADTTAATVSDEFMWGENILVAPVLDKDVSTRKYYLPEGIWYNPLHHELVTGALWHTDSVALADIPLFYREGSFVPISPASDKNTLAYTGSQLIITYTPSVQPSSYELYSDDGNNKKSLQNKKYEIISFSSGGKKAKDLMLTIFSDGGHYTGQPSSRSMIFVIPDRYGQPKEVYVNGSPLAQGGLMANMGKSGWMKNGKETLVKIEFKGRPVKIKFIW